MYGGVIIALLLIAVIESRLSKLTKLLIENFEKELCEAFRFCEGLKLPKREYQGKILYPCIMAKEPCFVYEEKGFFAPAPANLITGQEQDIKYLTGLLNSTFIYFAMRSFYMGGGIDGELKTNNLLKLPVPQITESNKPLCDQIIKCVEKILEIKACHTEALAEVSKNTESKKDISPTAQYDKADSTLDTKELESQIDSLVYTLYNLTNDEIEIIDSKT
ncbi:MULTISPECIES: TaqI-like C-terminal specificity domain-containing protein [Helicobacter]|uniref:TaqI-like C-terminal specificity domain-containing protein n=1 Tax=Helicobacter TaxID=209 RepID=UPI002FE00372